MGDRIIGGKYRLGKLLGRGGMGEVYEAHHAGTGRRVAVKLLKVGGADAEQSRELVTRFQREARATGALDSPHIVEVLDAGEDAETGEPFMVMEFLGGEDVTQLLRRMGPLPVQVALKICAQACLGLAKAHEAGIVHRDIKPGNIFLSNLDRGERVAKVLDFGIARTKNAGEDTELTRTGSMVGSPHYMSPEQARGLKNIDARADIWSMGVVLFRLLSDRTPHEQGDGGLGELLITICCAPPPSVQSVAPWVPPEVATVVDKALQLDREQRFENAKAMYDAIEPLLTDGLDLNESMLKPLADEQRTFTAARAPAANPDVSTDRQQVPITTMGSSSGSTDFGAEVAPAIPKPNRTPTVLISLVVAAAAAAGLIVVLKKQPPPAPVAPPVVASAPAVPGPTVFVPAQVVPVKVFLRVTPPTATVQVKGAPANREADGTVALTSPMGSYVPVTVTLNGKETQKDILITGTGPFPNILDVSPTPAGGSRGPKPQVSATAGPGPKPPPQRTNMPPITEF